LKNRSVLLGIPDRDFDTAESRVFTGRASREVKSLDGGSKTIENADWIQ
jgi:hypothetical protein